MRYKRAVDQGLQILLESEGLDAMGPSCDRRDVVALVPIMVPAPPRPAAAEGRDAAPQADPAVPAATAAATTNAAAAAAATGRPTGTAAPAGGGSRRATSGAQQVAQVAAAAPAPAQQEPAAAAAAGTGDQHEEPQVVVVPEEEDGDAEPAMVAMTPMVQEHAESMHTRPRGLEAYLLHTCAEEVCKAAQ